MRISRGVLVMKRLMVLALLAVTLPGCAHVHFESDIPGVAEGMMRVQRSTGLMPYCPEGATGQYRAGSYNRWSRMPANRLSVTCDVAQFGRRW